MEKLRIPLFPLHTVLFPGGALPLRVFESRYLDMISQCMRNETGFGICLIQEGSEVGNAPLVYGMGTLVSISYFQQLKDGCLGVTARGERRFRILSSETLPNQLIMAEVELIPRLAHQPLPDEYKSLANTLTSIINELGHPYTTLPKNYESATWVSARLTELLPIGLREKQTMLEMDDPLQRLKLINELLDEEPHK